MSAPTTESTPSAAPPGTEAKPSGAGSMLPILAVVVLVPVLSFVTTQYLLIPKLKATMAGGAEAKEDGAKKADPKKEGKAVGEKKENGAGDYAHSVEFGDIIVNLAGVKGTRYLRSRFTLASSDEKLDSLIKTNQNQLRDLAINVLSGQTLDSLEAPGARNAIRNELISQFNHALHGEVVEQIYFAEFVVQ